jgi:hypothetical protein
VALIRTFAAEMPWAWLRQSGKIIAMQNAPSQNPPEVPQPETVPPPAARAVEAGKPAEVGGPPGPEPTRFGDWEKAGRCIDF